MKFILLICSLIFNVAFGQGDDQTIPEEFRTRLGKVVDKTEWPGKVSRIVAVTYDYEQEASEAVVVEGRLHKGAISISKDLTAEQTKRLYAAITGTHVHVKGAMCFEPHHGFVFYDVEDKILGSLTICFGCNRYQHAPAGEVSKVFDLKALESLVLELQMPVAVDPEAYKKLFDKSKEGQQ